MPAIIAAPVKERACVLGFYLLIGQWRLIKEFPAERTIQFVPGADICPPGILRKFSSHDTDDTLLIFSQCGGDNSIHSRHIAPNQVCDRTNPKTVGNSL